jgi:hypothetical protein
MVPFLKKFGVCVGNGMSPFSVEFSTPEQLLNLMITYFKPPRRDPRDKEQGSNVDVQQMDDDDSDGDDTDNEEGDNGDSIEVEADLSATVIEEFINDSAEVDKDLQADIVKGWQHLQMYKKLVKMWMTNLESEMLPECSFSLRKCCLIKKVLTILEIVL